MQYYFICDMAIKHHMTSILKEKHKHFEKKRKYFQKIAFGGTPVAIRRSSTRRSLW